MINRRGFFTGLAGVPVVGASLAIAARPRGPAVHTARRAPAGITVTGAPDIDVAAALNVIAPMALSCFLERAKSLRKVKCNFEPIVSVGGDTIIFPSIKCSSSRGTVVTLDKHWNSSFCIMDMSRAVACAESDPWQLRKYVEPAAMCIADGVGQMLFDLPPERIIFVSRRLPMPLKGSALQSAYAETGDVGIRVTFTSNQVTQLVTVCLLCGCGMIV